MADFADIVEEIKNTNKKLDALTKATDPKGAAAAEDKKEEAAGDARSEGYLKTIAGAVSGGGPGGAGKEGEKEGKKAGGIFAKVAGALGKLGKGVGVGVGGFASAMAKALGNPVTGVLFVSAMTSLGLGMAGFIGALGLGAMAISKMMPTIAEGLTSFDEIDGKNLAEVGKGMAHLGVGLGAQGLGGAFASAGGLVTAIADGIGGIFGVKSGKDRIIDNLKEFSELDIDGDQVASNAEAMIAYGQAMAVGTGGTTLAAVGTFAVAVFDKLSSLIGGIPLLDRLKLFAAEKIDKAAVINNAEAMASYAEAMTSGMKASGAEFLSSLANFGTNIADGLSNLIGGQGVFETHMTALKAMSAASDTIIPENVENVSKAMTHYAAAMLTGSAASVLKVPGAIANIVTNIADGVSKLVGGKDVLTNQLDGLQQMSTASGKIDAAKVANVATAMVDYAKAMSVGAVGEGGKAVGSIFGVVTNIAQGLSSLITGEKQSTVDVMLAGLQKISAVEGIDGTKVSIIASAMVDYAKAMSAGAVGEGGKAAGAFSGFVTNAAEGLTSLITGKGTQSTLDVMLAGLQKLSDYTGIDAANVKKNAAAMSDYALAMSAGAGAEGASAIGKVANFVGGIVGSLGSFFGIDQKDPMEELQKFAAIKITTEELAQINTNASALEAYAGAMVKAQKVGPDETMWGLIGGMATGILKNVGSWLGVEEDQEGPLDKVKKFATKIITAEDVAQIDVNAGALESYAAAMVAANAVPIKPGVWTALGELFSGILGSLTNLLPGGDKDPMDMMKTFASKGLTEEESAQLTRNADSFKVYAEAMTNIAKAGAAFDDADIPDLKKFAEQLDASFPALNSAMEKFGDPTLFENYSNSGKNLEAIFSAFSGLTSTEEKKAVATSPRARGRVPHKAKGGPFQADQPMIVGELGPEMILPSSSGRVMNAQRTAQMQEASLRRNAVMSGGAGGKGTNISAPTTITTSQNSTTVTATPLMHPSPIIGMVNSAA